MDVAVTSSGQVLAIGWDAFETVLLARYNPDGSLDPTFGSGGMATTVFTSTASNFKAAASGVALQADGKFVVEGFQSWSTATGIVKQGMVLRYNADGSLDTTFGNGGVVTTVLPFGSTQNTGFMGVAIYRNAGTANDGKILVTGYVHTVTSSGQGVTEWAVVRYNPDGTLDTSFGSGTGYAIISDPKFTYPDDTSRAVAIDSDGKAIIVGSAWAYGAPLSPSYLQVARLNVDGSLDATFGNGGLVATAGAGWFSAVAVQPDGKIIAAGRIGSSGSSKANFVVARYLPSQPVIGSFTASPNPVTAGSSLTLTASNITDGNPSSTITQVTYYYIDSTGTRQVLGMGTQTSPGVWTLTFTVELASGNYTIFAQAKDSYGVFGDPLALSLQVL